MFVTQIRSFFHAPLRSFRGVFLVCALLCAATAQAAVPAGASVPEASPDSAAPSAAAQAEQPDYSPIHEKNIFDPERKPWAEKSAENTPPPPPPITSAEVQLYGVILIGDIKKALVKLDGRLKDSVRSSRPFVSLNEGQRVGEYTLAEIHPKELVFSAGDGRYRIPFNKKTDRPAPQAVPPVVQGPSSATPDIPTANPVPTPAASAPSRRSPVQMQGATPAPAPLAAADPASSNDNTPNPQPAPNTSGPGASGNRAAPANTANAPGGAAPGRGSVSLLDAINQARSRGGPPPPNPFTANR